MKNFGTLLIFAFLFTLVTEGYAQIFGVKAGLNLSNMHSKDKNESYDDNAKMNPGFHLGATAEFPIQDMFSFETGLMLSTKGSKMSETYGSNKYEATASPIYLEVPLTAKAAYDMNGTKFFGIFGPYLALGIAGKIKTTGTGISSTSEKIKWGSGDSDDLKGLDYGLKIGVGAEMNNIQFGLSYGYGLANLSIDKSDGMKIQNRVLEISVGYKLGVK